MRIVALSLVIALSVASTVPAFAKRWTEVADLGEVGVQYIDEDSILTSRDGNTVRFTVRAVYPHGAGVLSEIIAADEKKHGQPLILSQNTYTIDCTTKTYTVNYVSYMNIDNETLESADVQDDNPTEITGQSAASAWLDFVCPGESSGGDSPKQ